MASYSNRSSGHVIRLGSCGRSGGLDKLCNLLFELKIIGRIVSRGFLLLFIYRPMAELQFLSSPSIILDVYFYQILPRSIKPLQ